MIDGKERRKKIKFLLASVIILVVGVSLMSFQTTMIFQESDLLTELSRESQLSTTENTLVWETAHNPQYMDPHVDYESFGSWISYNVYETLYTYTWNTANAEPSVPLLAASTPVVSNGGLNYTITLREDITFHDGTPFNASCVKWNIERAMKIFYLDGPVWMIAEPLKGGAVVESAAYGYGPDSSQFISAFNDWVENSNSIIVLGDYTIRFVLEESYAPFIAALTYSVGSMISPSFQIAHATSPSYASWEDYGVDYGEYENYMAEHTCGTGPYMLTKWVPDHYIELDLYDNYWRTSTSTGAGSIEKVHIVTNEDASGRMLNLTTGATDGCYWPTSNALDVWDPDAEESLNPDIYVSTGGASFIEQFLGFNMGDLNTTGATVITSPFANKAFRQAASWAFDYDTFLQAAFNGFGVQAKGPIPYGMWGYNATSYNFKYNLTAAVEEWNNALTNTTFVDSLNEMGNNMTIYYNAGNTVREQASLLLADGLRLMTEHPGAVDQIAAGLNAEMNFTTQALEWFDYSNHIRFHQMPIFFVDWAPDYADPDNYVFAFCYEYGPFAYRIGFANNTVNDNYLLARAEMNLFKRMEYYNIINDVCAEEAPYLWTYQATEFRTWRTWLHGDGLIFNPMHQEYFYHMYKTIIDTTPPQIDNPVNILYNEFTTGHSITWHPTDITPQSYIIYLEGTPVKSGAWNSSSEVITISVDGLSLGIYNYTLVVTDSGSNSASDEVLVTVVDATSPTIDAPADIEYEEFTTGHLVTWNPSDLHPVSYVIYLEGVPVKSGAWNSSSETISISVDGLDIGEYNYTLEVTDIGSNTAANSVMVTVNEATIITTTPVTSTTIPTNSTVTMPDGTVMITLVISIGSAVVIIIIFIIVLKKRGN
jgi:peptide/nickel transport system substrate-binding protein